LRRCTWWASPSQPTSSCPLLGERGLLPVSRFTQFVSFRASPSLFFFLADRHGVRVCAWAGIGLAVLALIGWPQQRGRWSRLSYGVLWLLYLSFGTSARRSTDSAGKRLLEAGFLAIFLGGWTTAPSLWLVWMTAGCCSASCSARIDQDPRRLVLARPHVPELYFETQPIPEPFELALPLVAGRRPQGRRGAQSRRRVAGAVWLFAPQPVAGSRGSSTIAFQGVLIVSGNLSWLNWLTLVLCIPRSTIGFCRGCRFPLPRPRRRVIIAAPSTRSPSPWRFSALRRR